MQPSKFFINLLHALGALELLRDTLLGQIECKQAMKEIPSHRLYSQCDFWNFCVEFPGSVYGVSISRCEGTCKNTRTFNSFVFIHRLMILCLSVQTVLSLLGQEITHKILDLHWYCPSFLCYFEIPF